MHMCTRNMTVLPLFSLTLLRCVLDIFVWFWSVAPVSFMDNASIPFVVSSHCKKDELGYVIVQLWF